MNTKLVTFFTLFAILFGSAFSANIQLRVSMSSKWWVAAGPDANTVAVEVRNKGSLEWIPGTLDTAWGYWGFMPTSGNGFQLPLSFRFTAAGGNKVVAEDIMTSFLTNTVVDTKVQFTAGAPPAQATQKAATPAPTAAPTSAPPPAQATQKAGTPAPTGRATASPTPVPTQAAATVRPTAAPTAAPGSNLCADVGALVEPVKMMVPLYVYPGAAWDQLLAVAATGVKIVAIVNPNSGPNPAGPDNAYKNYMNRFKAAGIEMIGYVHTLWGARNVTTVLNEIDVYANLYGQYGINGIFFDEGATEAAVVPYYRTVYNKVMSKNWDHVVLNPGAQPAQGYFDVSTTIVIFENYATELYNIRFDPWVTCAPNAASLNTHKYRFSSIIHTAKQTDMAWLVTQSYQRGMGYVYITDFEGGCCTYNWLNSYFSAQGTYFKSFNLLQG